MINGQVLVENGQIIGLDLPTLIDHHNQLAKEIVARTEARYGHDLSTRVWRRLEDSIIANPGVEIGKRSGGREMVGQKGGPL